jgi:alpha-L-fucosidase 2
MSVAPTVVSLEEMKTRNVDLKRRLLLAASAGGALFRVPTFARDRSATEQRLRYLQPAAGWNEALPIGNGRLGAMVFGRVAQERLQLNEDTLWAGSPYTPDSPEALTALPEVRRLIESGRYKEAADLASARIMARPLRQMSYGTLGDVLIDFHEAQVPAEYERTLDLDTAVATTRYRTRAGKFVRESFASAPHQVIVLHLEATAGRMSFDVAYRAPRPAKYASPAYEGLATTLAVPNSTDWLSKEDGGEPKPGLQIVSDDDACLLVTGRNEAGNGIAGGLTFALRIRVICDGKAAINAGRIELRDARRATLLLSGATSYVNYQDVSGDPVARVRRDTDAAARIPYAELRRRHVRDYQALYRSASLSLPSTAAAGKPTDVRIAESESSSDPGLAALYLQFSRYLLISSSRPGSQPANLQGIWNEGTNPPWGSKYTININTEMNYWVADPAGLPECVAPLLQLVEELAKTGAATAKTMYGARGWVAHHNTDLWRAAAPIDGPFWGLWPCGGAWLCNSLWDHYDYGRDDATLKRLYPLMRGAALFFLDTLVEDPKGRGLVTSPSLSPENAHPFGSSLCAGPAMDRQIVRDLFAHTAEAATLLNDAAFAAEIRRAAARIAPDAIGKLGQLQEWLEDWDGDAPEQNHRHVSHLYAVYPSSQLNVRDNAAFIEAAKVSLNRRGDHATGWGTAWRLCLWARMGDGERAYSILKALLGPRRTYPNMFDAHPPFQIDGNFGGGAGILELLVQSWGGEIILLPALPAAWPRGEVRGIRARGAVRVDMGWAGAKVRWVELAGPPNSPIRLRRGGVVEAVRLDARGRYRSG